MKFPKQMSEELAELVGIHFGDGSLYQDNRYNYNIAYAGNLEKDFEFMNYLNSLFFKLFDIKLKFLISEKKNVVEIRIRSKELYYFFKNVLKIPVGKKIKLTIPTYIKNNERYLISFLRGLFDTDGCITLQRQGKYAYVLAKISTRHRNFAYEISKSLLTLSIPSFVTIKGSKLNNKIFEGYDVVIRNKGVIKFFKIVGTKNLRNIKSFNEKWGHRDLDPNLSVSSNTGADRST